MIIPNEHATLAASRSSSPFGPVAAQAVAPVREWAGRDAVALRKALRMTEAKFVQAFSVSARTVANWHTYPAMVPRNGAQDSLDELFTGAGPAVLERFERFGGHRHPASARSAPRPVPEAAQTLLRELVRQQHWKYETFCAEHEKAAARVAAADTAPSSAQYYLWLSGQLKGGMPYPDACRLLEAMFAPWKAADLFGPYQPGHDSPGPGDLERTLSNWAVSEWLAARKPARSPGPRDGGRVVSLGSHPRYSADFRALASGQVTEARTALGLTLAEFAALLARSLGWDVMPETVGRWEQESAPPGDVVLFTQAYLVGPR